MRHRFSRSIMFATLAAFAVSVPTTGASQQVRGGQWSVLDVTGTKPDARKHHTMVYDPVNNRVIMFGGENPTVLADLWVLNLGGTPSWQQITNATGDVPAARHGHSALYDATNSRMLLVGGRFDDGVQPANFPNGVWELKWNAGFVWDHLFNFPTGKVQNCQGVPAYCRRAFSRRTHSAVASHNGGLYMMGGQAAPGMISMQDTWFHPYNTTQWNHVSGSVWGIASSCEPCIDFTIPNLRHYHSMITDGHGRLVIFGGVYEDTPTSNAFYSTNGGSWSFLGSVPTGPHNFSREFHTAVFDPVADRMLVVGGYIRNGSSLDITDAVTSLPLPANLPQLTPPDDVNTNWVLHQPCGQTPGGIAEHAAVYDSQGDRVIVFGGVGTGGGLRNNDVWVLDFDETSPVAVTLSPAQIGKHASTISWTAPGDDGTVGTACAYDLRRSPNNITEANFYQATPLPKGPPLPAGESECGSTGEVDPCATYYYALKTIDDAGNVSAMSNVLGVTQNCSGLSYMCSEGFMASTPALPAAVEYSIRGANPATGTTSLFVGVPRERQGEAMEMSIYDVAGKRVRTLVNEAARAGEREVTWDLRNDGGTHVAAGVYFARLRLGVEARTHKIVIPQGR